ncbi:MAG TPA: ATP-binding cassette domain-containing protein [Candidatus Binatia bacterium]|nr:ATP-binding cassette domain-containing protein [Candidatus Binatia bacterium]
MSVTEYKKALLGRGLRKTFRRDTGEIVHALDGVSLEVEHGTLTALVGPDGAGKTTLIRLAAGLMTADSGELKILGIDVAADPQQVQDRIGYMPQRFGLYEDLSVQENLDLYSDLHGVTPHERRERYPRLMEMTALGPFTQRLAGRLSGGMKQKLGLACTLVRAPELLLLDEPTVGVDPLSRRELWDIIRQLVNDQRLTVLLSTSYLDEAERCGHVIVMHQGKVLAQGRPSDVSGLAAGRVFLAEPPAGRKAREFQAQLLDHPGVVDAVPEGGRVRFVRAADTDPSARREISFDDVVATLVPPRFEDGFMVLLQQTRSKKADGETGKTDGEIRTQGHKEIEEGVSLSPSLPVSQSVSWSPGLHVSLSFDAVVQVRDLVRQFGRFIAVNHISFAVQRGEIFGLLGPNGAGKTTTFRMLCGLLPATSGTLRVAGVDLRRARASARQKIGYVAQKFSLYGQLSVNENLEFFASAYNLRGERKRDRIDWALQQFDLAPLAGLPSGNLPGGFKQRLAMAAALLHGPDILFLDEPTSGADPLARREFWRRITALSEQGVTAVVTTHFMEEAEYCDRVAIMDAGRMLAQGTPAEIRSRAPAEPGREPAMEDAFIAVVEQAREGESNGNFAYG